MNTGTSDFSPFIFWAKLPRRREEFPPQRFHPLLCHMIDVAAVVECLWQNHLPDAMRHRFAADLNLSMEAAGKWLALLAGLHDLGKLCPKFQFIREAEVLYKDKASLLHGFYRDASGARCPDGAAYHQWVTTVELPRIIVKDPFSVDEKSAKRFAEILGGHHGAFPSATELMNLKDKYRRLCVGIGMWEEARERLVLLLANALEVPLDAKPQGAPERIESNAFAMMFAGLVSVADWIGSNADYFTFAARSISAAPLIDARSYLRESKERAGLALKMLGWGAAVKTDKSAATKQSFAELFAYLTPGGKVTPNELQQTAIDRAAVFAAPCLAVIEAPMGTGKTEAAMYLADRWSIAPERNGCYFALPTQATSNQMYERVRRFIAHRLPDENINFQLLHGHAALSAELKVRRIHKENNTPPTFKATGIYNEKQSGDAGRIAAEEWFMHRKRGLLAPFGVGTVDQILLAALQTRHFFVRLFGLAGKTIIIDEVHAYDAYMSALLERLLEWLAALDCSVVLLSATLPTEKRRALVAAYLRGRGQNDEMDLPSAAYPRLTWTHGALAQAEPLERQHATVDETQQRKLHIKLIDGELPDTRDGTFALGEELQRALAAGGCAAVICNTVDRAQRLYAALKSCFERYTSEHNLPRPDVYLFHARYLFKDRERLEKEVLWRFGKHGDEVDFGDEGEHSGKRKVERPHRAVLVATQVIEQSLDLDFDLMVSDFAPIDLLLQRSGRIHRHANNPRYELPSPTLWLRRPHLLKGVPHFDDGTEVVYSTYILLRSWLALNQIAKSADDTRRMMTINLPADIETLVEAAYTECPCPDNLSDELRARWQKTEQKDKDMVESHRNQASVKSLHPPTYGSHLGGFSQQEFEEDVPQIHQAHQALTRLGDSIQVVCLYGTKNHMSFDAAGTQRLDPAREPGEEETERLLHHALSISLKGLVHALRDEAVPPGWVKSPLLRHYRLVALDEPPPGYRLTLDVERGLVVEKE